MEKKFCGWKNHWIFPTDYCEIRSFKQECLSFAKTYYISYFNSWNRVHFTLDIEFVRSIEIERKSTHTHEQIIGG